MRCETIVECADAFSRTAFDTLELSDEDQALLRTPRREVQVELPLRRDDGSIQVHRGFRVQHDNSRGPFKGGLRYNPEASVEHFRGLAQLMTWKTALVNVPFGGAKGGIDCDPHELSKREAEDLTKRFTDRISKLLGPDVDIPAPDMGTSAREMAWIYEAYSQKHGDQPAVVTGKPERLGGTPVRAYATGLGVALVAGWAAEANGMELPSCRIALQGFGNVASNAARFLHERDALIVAVSDARGGLYHPDGLPIPAMLEAGDFRDAAPDDAEEIGNEDLLTLDVDVLIPAAIEAVIREDNVRDVAARLIIEAANAPITSAADAVCRDRGVPVVPDILANAGGVVVSYMEWVQSRQRYQWTTRRIEQELEDILFTAWHDVVDAAEECASYRIVGYERAVIRVKESMDLRGF